MSVSDHQEWDFDFFEDSTLNKEGHERQQISGDLRNEFSSWSYKSKNFVICAAFAQKEITDTYSYFLVHN
jgi:hypothetical protein